MDRAERMLNLGVRTGLRPRDVSERIMRAYVDIAGGWSGDPKAQALTDAELDKIEKLVVDAELAWASDPDRGRSDV
jgi:hypothetical protein